MIPAPVMRSGGGTNIGRVFYMITVKSPRRGILRLFPIAIMVLTGLAAAAAPRPGVAQATESGQPLPRFVSLGKERVFLRQGPGQRYPVAWEYLRAGMPVEIIEEFEHWRKVRDWESDEGWIHRTMLSNKRTALVKNGIHALRDQPNVNGRLVAQVRDGAVGEIVQCPEGTLFCEVRFKKIFSGWILRSALWGVREEEIIN